MSGFEDSPVNAVAALRAGVADDGPAPPLPPRKLPRQRRSIVTVDAIHEATIELLKRDGQAPGTTRVAERAGVSVGTLYQYFPNRETLVFAALCQHLDRVGAALENLYAQHRGKPVGILAVDLAAGYMELKTGMAAQRRSLQHHMAAEMAPVRAAVVQRAGRALETLLASVPDASFPQAPSTAAQLVDMMQAATWPAIDRANGPEALAGIRGELVMLVGRHLLSAAGPARARPAHG